MKHPPCFDNIVFASCLFISCYIWLHSKSEETLYKKPRRQKFIFNFTENYKQRLPKFILLWTRDDRAPFDYFGEAQNSFIKNNCPVIDCYVTADRYFFGGDLSRFDAIAFNGRHIDRNGGSDLPVRRHPHQKYIFFNMESADNQPVCNKAFDAFFNWTSTYKINSDIPYPYILIRNAAGEVVGPKANMDWNKLEFSNAEEEFFYNKWKKKKKAAAWIVSHCKTRSGRRRYVDQLQEALKKYGWTIDIYGGCGPLKCPRANHDECVALLEREYFFYLSLENSFAEDYVTEKLLTALLHNVVPIVYGGANYSRYLHPSSYLNARDYTPEELALIMDHYIKSGRDYAQFFKWRSHYTYHDPTMAENVCAVCAALNDRTKFETVTTYHNFREWWNPEYENRCSWWRSNFYLRTSLYWNL